MTTEAGTGPNPTATLERAFNAVGQRMQGLGFVNPALRVQAVGFEPWESHWLGVMVTPWSINLLLLPRDPAAWRPIRPGEKQRYAFPAGDYDFIDAIDPVVGEYRMCSLFSPAFEFQDHASAVMVAELARAALFDASHSEPPQAQDQTGTPSGGPLTRLERQAKAPLSKRDFLRGRFLRSEETDVPRR
jgi:[NiFe] hydrogenase assembly HybE family chaperone